MRVLVAGKTKTALLRNEAPLYCAALRSRLHHLRGRNGLKGLR